MATLIECSQHIPYYTPEQVFDVGTRVEMLPTDVEGFELNVCDEYFALGVAAQVRFAVLGQDIHLKGKFSQFIPNERVMIQANASRKANVDVWLDLFESEEGGTQIDYGIKVVHHPLTKLLEKPVKQILDEKVQIFATGFTDNVVTHLNALHRPARRRKAA